MSAPRPPSAETVASSKAMETYSARQRNGPFYAFRDPRLSFGALISTFPIGERIST